MAALTPEGCVILVATLVDQTDACRVQVMQTDRVAAIAVAALIVAVAPIAVVALIVVHGTAGPVGTWGTIHPLLFAW